MRRCRWCGVDYPDSSKICRACGAILDEVETPSLVDRLPAAPSASSVDTAEDSREGGWKCPQCGEISPSTFERCWNCASTEEVADAAANTAGPAGDAEHRRVVESTLSQHRAVPTGCARCGSDRMISGVKIVDQGESSDGRLKVVVEGNPNALVFKDRLYGPLTANICAACGHVELHVSNPGELYEHYVRSRTK